MGLILKNVRSSKKEAEREGQEGQSSSRVHGSYLKPQQKHGSNVHHKERMATSCQGGGHMTMSGVKKS